jgi:hypothetical protein
MRFCIKNFPDKSYFAPKVAVLFSVRNENSLKLKYTRL